MIGAHFPHPDDLLICGTRRQRSRDPWLVGGQFGNGTRDIIGWARDRPPRERGTLAPLGLQRRGDHPHERGEEGAEWIRTWRSAPPPPHRRGGARMTASTIIARTTSSGVMGTHLPDIWKRPGWPLTRESQRRVMPGLQYSVVDRCYHARPKGDSSPPWPPSRASTAACSKLTRIDTRRWQTYVASPVGTRAVTTSPRSAGAGRSTASQTRNQPCCAQPAAAERPRARMGDGSGANAGLSTSDANAVRRVRRPTSGPGGLRRPNRGRTWQ